MLSQVWVDLTLFLSLSSKVNKALKQKSDIEHYRNKLRLKAKRKGYYDFPPVEAGKGLAERKMYEKAPKEVEHVLDADPELCAPFAESKNRCMLYGCTLCPCVTWEEDRGHLGHCTHVP